MKDSRRQQEFVEKDFNSTNTRTVCKSIPAEASTFSINQNWSFPTQKFPFKTFPSSNEERLLASNSLRKKERWNDILRVAVDSYTFLLFPLHKSAHSSLARGSH